MLHNVKVPFLDLKLQNAKIKSEAMEKFSEVFDSGAFILGQEVTNFEKNIAKYLGIKYAIGVSSGTDAILVALMALGIRECDEVICPSFTFFATASAVVRLGGIPIFADIDLDNFNISCEKICEKISAKTKAILVVHLFGQTAPINEIVNIGRKFNIPVIEDCAQSFGAKCHDKQSGTFGQIGCFSFFPTKNLGGFGDSGLICTDNDDLAEKIKILRNHGMKPQYFHRYIGGNFRIDELQAAMLNVKLPHVGAYIVNRRKNAEIYLDALDGLASIVLPKEIEGNFHTWNQFTIRVLAGKRDAVCQALQENGIGYNIYYPLPLDAQECFKQFIDPQNLTSNAALASKEVLSLPIYPELTSDQILHVTTVLKQILRS
ncbi:MAG: DegT/DnrJ/EryC1/StrS family aminotransferase [Puniceicoccales bacterium]|jgi:dTDP-4-amino-4,6-dideoxygalactose transaminase|nr:DegT/DnrJ/EryC1/StrS family aminotransferase [Puniceicoccales bacterium]